MGALRTTEELNMTDYRFTITLDSFDASLLLLARRRRDRGFGHGSASFLQNSLRDSKGMPNRGSEETVTVEWTPPSTINDPIQVAVASWKMAKSSLPLHCWNCWAAACPRFPLAFQLGLAYSNLYRLKEARTILGMAIGIDPLFPTFTLPWR